ncbi:hypothetical protein [Sphingobacterium kyonggiense]
MGKLVKSVFDCPYYKIVAKYFIVLPINLLTMTMRTDGFSKYISGNRWGYFPGISAGWRISEEHFFRNPPFPQELKIKGGWRML